MTTTNTFFNTAGGSVTNATGAPSLFTPPYNPSLDNTAKIPLNLVTSGFQVFGYTSVDFIYTNNSVVGDGTVGFAGYKNGVVIWSVSGTQLWGAALGITAYPTWLYNHTNKRLYFMVNYNNASTYWYRLGYINLETGAITNITAYSNSTTAGSTHATLYNAISVHFRNRSLLETSYGSGVVFSIWSNAGIPTYITLDFNNGTISSNTTNSKITAVSNFIASANLFQTYFTGNYAICTTGTLININTLKNINIIQTTTNSFTNISTLVHGNCRLFWPCNYYDANTLHIAGGNDMLNSFGLQFGHMDKALYDTYITNLANYYGI